MMGIAVLFDTALEDDGWRGELKPLLIATWDGQKAIVYTDISMSEKSLKVELRDIESFDYDILNEAVGHNLHGKFRGGTFDILRAVKKASAPVLQNEGKRFDLYDLARWNGVRSLPVELISRMRKGVSWMKGQHINCARWAIEDAMMCYDLYHAVKKSKRVRFLDTKTGKKPYADVSWPITEEEE
tara:strand:- start:31228 stop:31782 length:555 start_codon:yes stop_codon:yes gene_type:complete